MRMYPGCNRFHQSYKFDTQRTSKRIRFVENNHSIAMNGTLRVDNAPCAVFQLIDVTVSDSAPTPFPYKEVDEVCGDDFLDEISKDQEAPSPKGVSVIMVGCTDEGDSILVKVSGFKPYVFMKLTGSVKSLLHDVSLQCNLPLGSLSANVISACDLYGWEPDSIEQPTGRKKHRYAQVFFPSVKAMRHVRYNKSLVCHEHNIAVETQFMDSLKITASGWVKVKGINTVHSDRVSHCKIELSCKTIDVLPVQRDAIAPLLVAAVDIECISASGAFPDAEIEGDAIMQIGVVLWRVGAPISEAVKFIFLVGRCDEIENVRVFSFPSEKALLSGFRAYMVATVDPDIITTYNGFGFDCEYMCKRATMLKCDDFFYWNRIVTSKLQVTKKELTSSALGSNDIFVMNFIGRCNLDIYHWVKSQKKLVSYKLDSVCEYFLEEKKIEMDYKLLFKWACGSSAEIARVATYCVQDCYLLIALIIRLQIISANVEMSRVCYTPMESLVTRGQQLKVMNQLVHYGHEQGYVINTPKAYSGLETDSYEGATVLEAKSNYYTTPIAVLDFMSLYPSIIMANNLCFSTLVLNPAYLNLKNVVYDQIKVGETKVYTWVKGITQADGSVNEMPGLLPIMLGKLLCARKIAKAAKANAKSDVEKSVFDGRQLALKISANSIYGFTGAVKRGLYPCLGIADCTTWHARNLMTQTVAWVKEMFVCDVVYGDTDSVMVKFANASTIEECFRLGDIASEKITSLLGKNIILEMEKVYHPYLLLCKKRYVGLIHEKDNTGVVKKPYIDAKGIELVRRDNCPFARRVMSDVVDELMYNMDVHVARDAISHHMKKLIANELPMSDYIMSKSRGKVYVNDCLPHITVCKKMATRNPGSEPQVGDRVAYVLIETSRDKSKTYQKAEDPLYAEEHNLKVDRLYYVEHQLVNAIGSIMQFAVQDAPNIFKNYIQVLKHQQEKQTTLSRWFHPQPSTQASSLNIVDVTPSNKKRRTADDTTLV